MEEFLALKQDHNITLPNSVIDMFEGSLGIPEGGWPEHIAKIILQGRKTTEGRPGAAMPAVDLDETAKKLEAAIEEKPSRTDLMSYLMYPEVFVKFAKSRADHGDIEVLPSPAFFYGMAKGEEISFDIEAGKTLIVKFLTTSEPNPDGTRNVFFELNGQPREVQVKDKTLKSTMAERAKADPSNPGHVAAPIPGAVTTIHVKEGTEVKKGAPLLVLEAMKMQTTVTAPNDGTVKEILVKTGETVEPKDLLVILE